MTIWKYPLKVTDIQNVEMPAGARVLSAHVQRDTICVWVLADPAADRVRRQFRIFGTGVPVGEIPMAEFVATVHFLRVGLVFHVFDYGEVPS